MNIYLKKIITLVNSIIALVLPYSVLAASSAYKNLQKVGEGETGEGPYVMATKDSLSQIVGIVIQTFLGILGVLFLSYLLYAGYSWMTAQGEEEKVTKAKDTIQRAIIGLVVTIGAYAISYFVLQRLVFSGGILK
jgi:hypothetical protein